MGLLLQAIGYYRTGNIDTTRVAKEKAKQKIQPGNQGRLTTKNGSKNPPDYQPAKLPEHRYPQKAKPVQLTTDPRKANSKQIRRKPNTY